MRGCFGVMAQQQGAPDGTAAEGTHLVNEGGEAIVEGLDLLFLLGADHLDAGVDLQVQGRQEALVDRHRRDGGRSGGHASPHASTHASTHASGHTHTATHAHTATHTSADGHVAILYGTAAATTSLARPPGCVPAHHEAPAASTHAGSAGAHTPIGAADGEGLLASTGTPVAGEGAAAVAPLARASPAPSGGGGPGGDGGGLQSSDRHGHTAKGFMLVFFKSTEMQWASVGSCAEAETKWKRETRRETEKERERVSAASGRQTLPWCHAAIYREQNRDTDEVWSDSPLGMGRGGGVRWGRGGEEEEERWWRRVGKARGKNSIMLHIYSTHLTQWSLVNGFHLAFF